MMNLDGQTTKVEQTPMGEVVAFRRPELKAVDGGQQAKGTSPNQGYAATGRTREHLTPTEVDRLLTAAKRTARNGHRNYCAVLLAYRHGLRVGELVDLRWSDVDFEAGTILIRRMKGSKSGNHPMMGDEIRALRKLQRESSGPYILANSKGAPLATSAISSMVKRLGGGVFDFPIHVHMLRHSCGYYLANKGVDTRTIQDYLGHRSIENTARYTALAAGKFRTLWD